MRTIKKQISVLLAVLMVLSSIMAVSFSVSAAETTGGTITVNSNLCDSKTYNYTATDKQIQVTYYLQCNNKILNMQGGVYYDSSVLKVADTNTMETSIPKFTSGSSFVNFDLTNKALFNATSLNLYDFTSKGVFFTVTFDIIGSGDTEVNLDIDVITATTANSFTELKDASDIDLVYYDNIMADKFAFSSQSKLIGEEGSATLKFLVPKTKTSPKCWDNGVYLAYSDNYVLSTFTKIALTKTTEYLTPEIKSSNLTEDTYAMYQVTLTAEQAKAVNDAKFTILMNNENSYRTYINAKYNILMAPVGSDTEVYNTAKTSISALDGYTFVMNNEVQLGTSIQGFGTFTGFWTKCIDIHAVAPSAAKWNNCWNKGVYLCYSDTYTLDSFTKIKMTRTSTYVDVTSNSEQLISGSYPLYTVSLTEDQVRAIDAAKFVIFEDSTGAYRTYINARYGILQAPVDEYSDTYGSRVSIADRANNTFVMCGGISTGTSIEGYGTFTGYWSTTQLEIVESTATLYCVFPAPAKNKKAMSNGVYLAYGNSGAIGDLTYLEMEKTTQTYTPSLKTNMLVAGDYSVYKITLTGSQLEAVDNAHNVIFCNKTGSYRTLLVTTYNVFKAKSGTYSATYNAGKFVAEDHNGETFVVCDSKVTGISSTDGYGTFLGFWDTGK